MRKSFNRALFILAASCTVYACADERQPEALNARDREIAKELESWEKQQNKLPDSERYLRAGFGSDLLIEKASNLKIGTHLYTEKSKGLVELRISQNQEKKSFILGSTDTCPDSSFNIIESKPKYIYFLNSCFYKNKKGVEENTYTFLLYDRKSKLAIELETTSQYRKTKPSLTLNGDIYRYRWKGKNLEKQPINVFFDFKLEANQVECKSSWNDECPFVLEIKNKG